MRLLTRAVLISVLVIGLVGLTVHFAVAYEQRQPYPSADSIDQAYEDYVGEDVLLYAEVTSVDRANRRAHVEAGELRLTVHRFDVSARPGGLVQVYGRLRPGREMIADGVVVVNPSQRSEWQKYAISLVGALLVTGLFFRHWRINTAEFVFEAR